MYFTGDNDRMEPLNSLHAVADGTMKTIGHLFAASICNYGPAPNFLSTWVFDYMIGGVEKVMKQLPANLNESSDYLCKVYNLVSSVIRSFLYMVCHLSYIV